MQFFRRAKNYLFFSDNWIGIIFYILVCPVAKIFFTFMVNIKYIRVIGPFWTAIDFLIFGFAIFLYLLFLSKRPNQVTAKNCKELCEAKSKYHDHRTFKPKTICETCELEKLDDQTCQIKTLSDL